MVIGKDPQSTLTDRHRHTVDALKQHFLSLSHLALKAAQECEEALDKGRAFKFDETMLSSAYRAILKTSAVTTFLQSMEIKYRPRAKN